MRLCCVLAVALLAGAADPEAGGPPGRCAAGEAGDCLADDEPQPGPIRSSAMLQVRSTAELLATADLTEAADLAGLAELEELLSSGSDDDNEEILEEDRRDVDDSGEKPRKMPPCEQIRDKLPVIVKSVKRAMKGLEKRVLEKCAQKPRSAKCKQGEKLLEKIASQLKQLESCGGYGSFAEESVSEEAEEAEEAPALAELDEFETADVDAEDEGEVPPCDMIRDKMPAIVKHLQSKIAKAEKGLERCAKSRFPKWCRTLHKNALKHLRKALKAVQSCDGYGSFVEESVSGEAEGAEEADEAQENEEVVLELADVDGEQKGPFCDRIKDKIPAVIEKLEKRISRLTKKIEQGKGVKKRSVAREAARQALGRVLECGGGYGSFAEEAVSEEEAGEAE